MKWLTGIQLINWHYFVNETIRIRGSALFTGDNGAGKSTILDAIQYALIADQRKVRFNVSAHEETNRDLKGYLRCRTGRDDPNGGDGYLRSGDFTSYVALEFQDTIRKEPLLLGFAVDTLAGEPDSAQFFRLPGALDPNLFVTGDRPYSVSEFKAVLRGCKGGELFGTASAYRTAVRAQLGHLDDRFFTLLVKALAFHPITDIRRFVYDYVLDEREVKIDAMLENFRQYRHYDLLVAQTREKLERLEAIGSRHQERTALEATAAIQQYVILRAAREVEQEALAGLQQSEQQALRDKAAAAADLAQLRADEARLTTELRDLQDARARNDGYLALQALDKQLLDLNRQAEGLQQEAARLTRDGRRLALGLTQALELATAHPDLVPAAAESLTAIADGVQRLQPLVAGDTLADPADLSDLAPVLERLGDLVVGRQSKLQDEANSLQSERKELDETLSGLRNQRKRRYPAQVEALQNAIRARLPAVEPRPLCELIEIPDERWQNAVEGYLNTQRFDLFVAADRFDQALAVYEAEKVEQKIYGVGLVNSQALLRGNPTAQAGSLAEEVTTEDPAARAYTDRLLGRVIKCGSEQELKQHPIAITPTCMTYRNHTARQIEPHLYATPYIGTRAIYRQIALKEARLVAVVARLEELAALLQRCSHLLQQVRGHDPMGLMQRWADVARLPALQAQIHQKETERAQIDTESLNALQRQIEKKQADLTNLGRQREAATRRDEGLHRDLKSLTTAMAAAESRWQERHTELERYVGTHPETAEPGAARYQEALRRSGDRIIQDNFTRARLGLLTQIEKLEKELYQHRLEYNNRYQFGGAPDACDNDAYAQEHTKLAQSELPAYETHIAEARRAAEEEFKEHFIFKLQENIRLARQEFDSLNRVLKEVPFGQDRYQFVMAPHPGNRSYYEMIMDQTAMEGFTLFSFHFREKYGATLDELFRLILDVPEEKQAENIRRYTDYREYLEFDIRIHHQNGETSSFSKVAREKSGGETQTPFYVAMVASFLQLYRPRQNPHTIRLMMFDEAFNRMDPDRAENMLDFIRKLGLQVLAAAPTDKCEIIAPHVESTLLVIREGHRAWLEDYHQVLAANLTEAEVAATGEGAADESR